MRAIVPRNIEITTTNNIQKVILEATEYVLEIESINICNISNKDIAFNLKYSYPHGAGASTEATQIINQPLYANNNRDILMPLIGKITDSKIVGTTIKSRLEIGEKIIMWTNGADQLFQGSVICVELRET